MPDHAELLKRLREATGADREIDAMIHAIQRGGVVFQDGNRIQERAKDGRIWYLGMIDPGVHQRNFSIYDHNTPCYTKSIDAAVALVEKMLPGYNKNISIHEGYTHAWVVPNGPDSYGVADPRTGDGTAPTPALALCIALLEALQARAASEGA